MRIVVLLNGIERLLARWWCAPIVVRSLLPLGVMGILWWSSAQSPPPREPSLARAFLHNGAHVVAYAALAVAVRLVFPAVPRRRPTGDAVSFGLALAYGIVDELHQSSVPGRVCSASDVFSDAAGAWLGLLVLAACGASVVAARRLALVAAVCLACVAFATFGPW